MPCRTPIAGLPPVIPPTQGLVLDLRGNPGGLLTSAVDVATLFVPKGSDIVSAKGRGFPETLYRSKTDPALSPTTHLAVLVNKQAASATEIVTGTVQDLDVGVVVGKGRTFGKGLVQNVQDLPYQTGESVSSTGAWPFLALMHVGLFSHDASRSSM